MNPTVEFVANYLCRVLLGYLGGFLHSKALIGSAGKESVCNAGDPSSIPGSGRSPREGNSYLLQYSFLENSMDSMAHGVAKSQTQLSNFHLGNVS